jgi:hypothetical protein
MLMDIVVPGTNGYQATSHIPVSLCSGKTQDTDPI